MNFFIGHLLGDYILQTDYQALGKVRSSWICLLHVVLYTVAIYLFTRWPWWALLITAGTHFAIDRFRLAYHWMGFNNQKVFREKMAPWSIVVVDNTFHLIQLYVTAALVQRSLAHAFH